MVTIRNINERHGDSLLFTAENLETAVAQMQQCIRECGKEFEGVVITDNDYEVVRTWFAMDGERNVWELIADDEESAIAEVLDCLREWNDDYPSTDWGEYWLAYSAEEPSPDSDAWKQHTATLHPIEPECDDGEHKWESPVEIVGGIKENPGVWGHGGGVRIQEVCLKCGCGKLTDTWAQRLDTGEQGLRSITYDRNYLEKVRQGKDKPEYI